MADVINISEYQDPSKKRIQQRERAELFQGYTELITECESLIAATPTTEATKARLEELNNLKTGLEQMRSTEGVSEGHLKTMSEYLDLINSRLPKSF